MRIGVSCSTITERSIFTTWYVPFARYIRIWYTTDDCEDLPPTFAAAVLQRSGLVRPALLASLSSELDSSSAIADPDASSPSLSTAQLSGAVHIGESSATISCGRVVGEILRLSNLDGTGVSE